MDVRYLPVLGALRELYAQPRDMNRFKRYIATMLGGTDGVVLPIGVANPMAKEHALAKLDELLTLGAEEIGAKAAAEAAARLRNVPPAGETVKASLVLADDLHGGWTNRYLTEASVRFQNQGSVKRGFACGLLWTSESPVPAEIRQELLGAIYRLVYQRHHGQPSTLREMLAQEGLAGQFAGATPALAPDELAECRRVIAMHLDTRNYPVAFACLYGDEAAVSVGYLPLGLPPRAAFEVALADARADGHDPVAVLLT